MISIELQIFSGIINYLNCDRYDCKKCADIHSHLSLATERLCRIGMERRHIFRTHARPIDRKRLIAAAAPSFPESPCSRKTVIEAEARPLYCAVGRTYLNTLVLYKRVKTAHKLFDIYLPEADTEYAVLLLTGNS